MHAIEYRQHSGKHEQSVWMKMRSEKERLLTIKDISEWCGYWGQARKASNVDKVQRERGRL